MSKIVPPAGTLSVPTRGKRTSSATRVTIRVPHWDCSKQSLNYNDIRSAVSKTSNCGHTISNQVNAIVKMSDGLQVTAERAVV